MLKICALILALGATPVLAEDDGLDPHSKDALEKTQALLNVPVERAKAIQENENTKKADDSVKRLGLNKEGNDEVYKLSGQILETIVKDSKGDAAAMAIKAQELMKDPESFEKILTPEQREKIRKLASDAEESKGPPPVSQ
jgi:hypothetical protein